MAWKLQVETLKEEVKAKTVPVSVLCCYSLLYLYLAMAILCWLQFWWEHGQHGQSASLLPRPNQNKRLRRNRPAAVVLTEPYDWTHFSTPVSFPKIWAFLQIFKPIHWISAQGVTSPRHRSFFSFAGGKGMESYYLTDVGMLQNMEPQDPSKPPGFLIRSTVKMALYGSFAFFCGGSPVWGKLVCFLITESSDRMLSASLSWCLSRSCSSSCSKIGWQSNHNIASWRCWYPKNIPISSHEYIEYTY